MDIQDNTSNGIPMNMGGASEIDVTSGGGEVIDPKQIAAEISTQPTEDLSKTSAEGDNTPPQEGEPLQIIDKTKDLEDDEDKEPKPTEDPAPSQKTKESNTDSGEAETFKILGSHFSEEGILEGYTDEMENTPEAFQELITKTVEKQVENYKNSFENPMTKQFLEYIENGGQPGQFMELMSGPDYSKITVEAVEDNDTTAKQVLRDYFTKQGEDPAEIEETIEAFEDAGHLEKRAKSALGKLQAIQGKEREQALEDQKAAKIKQAENVEKYVSDLKTTIDSKDSIGDFAINKKTKSEFFDYITKPDPKTGQTKLYMDSQDPEKQLMMSFYYFNNFNFDKLSKKAKSEANKDLAAKLSNFTDPSNKQTSRKTTPVDKTGGDNLAALKAIFK